MSVRTLLLVLSTSTVSILTGCATSQTAAREDTAAASTPSEVAEGEFRGCRCSLNVKAEDGSAQAAAGRGCQCPHCSHGASGIAGKGPSCGCWHNNGKGDQVQAQEGAP